MMKISEASIEFKELGTHSHIFINLYKICKEKEGKTRKYNRQIDR